MGAVLTQNTSWVNVEKALINLYQIGLIDPKKILEVDENIIKEAIRPAGYYNQKTKYLMNISNFFYSLNGKTPLRHELLKVKGIGEETCDSILLYAYGLPEFVVDTYAKRFLTELNYIRTNLSYSEVKLFFQNKLEKDVKVYQEFHALLVEHGKRYYSKKPFGCNFLDEFKRKDL